MKNEFMSVDPPLCLSEKAAINPTTENKKKSPKKLFRSTRLNENIRDNAHEMRVANESCQ